MKVLSAADMVKLGDSEVEVSRKLRAVWSPVLTNKFVLRYPSNQLVPYTNSATISEWQAVDQMTDGHPWVLFILFDSPEHTNVIDVLLWNASSIKPMVDGVYNRKLQQIRNGDSMLRVFTALGHPDCAYYIADGGKWRTKFTYMTFEGKFIELDVDAATGLVIRKRDRSLDFWQP